MRARELAEALRREEEASVFLELATLYLNLTWRAEGRALYHADRGDLWVTYEEAADARWGWAYAGVAVAAWAAATAKSWAQRQAARLDCASTDGAQLELDPDGAGGEGAGGERS